MHNMKSFFVELAADIYSVSFTLFKLMIPVIVIVKVLEEIGAVYWLGLILSPLMGLIGLPDSMGLVWATTISTNIYAGMLVFFTQPQQETLTVAQVTVLGGLLLLAHGLPIEARIAQIAGVRLRATLVLRIGGSLVFAWLLNQIYSQGDWLQQPNELLWKPGPLDEGLAAWALMQGKSLLLIQVVIALLLTVLKILKALGIEKLIAWLLKPLLKVLGIGSEATTITIVGVTLGLAFGGGLLIKEARQGHISTKDIFTSLAFLGLCHSLIEDTLLVMLLGAHISGALWLRLLFALIVTAILSRWIDRRSEHFCQRHLNRPQQHQKAA